MKLSPKLTWIGTSKEWVERNQEECFTLSHRTRGPNCFFLSVCSFVSSLLPIVKNRSVVRGHNLCKNLISKPPRCRWSLWPGTCFLLPKKPEPLKVVSYYNTISTLVLNSSTTFWNSVTLTKAWSLSWMMMVKSTNSTIETKWYQQTGNINKQWISTNSEYQRIKYINEQRISTNKEYRRTKNIDEQCTAPTLKGHLKI